MTKEINVNQLATAVKWWMGYTSAMGREYILNESAIKFPVSEYLERSRIDNISLEYGHPKLQKKRFDLFYQNERHEKFVFEFKYIKRGYTEYQNEKQRIFNDIMRLYLYLDSNQQGFFLICGSQFDFFNSFVSLQSKPKGKDDGVYIETRLNSTPPPIKEPSGFYTKWFSFDRNDPYKIIDLNNTHSEYKEIYDNFKINHEEAYKEKTCCDLVLPNSIKTELKFLSEDTGQSIDFFKQTKIGIWEVLRTI